MPKRYLVLFICIWITSIVTAHPLQQGDELIRFGETVAGDLAVGEQDTWAFDGRAGQRVSIAAERTPPDQHPTLDPHLELLSPDGQFLVSDDDTGPNQDATILGFVLPTSGIYRIKVSSFENTGSGIYELTLAQNTLPNDCGVIAGTVVTHEWYSTIADENLRYRVYLPPCYENARRRYPYIILMHGSASTDTHWDMIGMDEAVTMGIALNRIPPLALVMPYGGEIANLNVFYLDGSYEYVILNEVMPSVEENYCLRTDQAGRAIGGISRGGFWAYEIGLRHPELFSAIGGHSPVFDLYHAPPSHNPLNVIDTIEWTEDFPRLYLDRGKDDYWQMNIDLMPPLLDANNFPYTFVLNEGNHNEAYWGTHLNDYLEFYSADWISGLGSYPLCDSGLESE